MRTGVAAQQRAELPVGTPAKYAGAGRKPLGAGKMMLASNELFAMYFRVVYVLEKGNLQ